MPAARSHPLRSVTSKAYVQSFVNQPMLQVSRMNRPHRNELATIIRRYLDSEISAFELDNQIDLYLDSDDATVEYVAFTVWHYYDDCKDHHVNLTKPQWNYFQRLLLLLESNAHIVETTNSQWNSSQLLAAFCLLISGMAAHHSGIGMQLLPLLMPLGLVSICIARLPPQPEPASEFEHILMPFSTFADLAKTRESAPQFQKQRYPKNLPDHRSRTATTGFIQFLPTYVLWMLLSPIVLFSQIFPRSYRKTRVEN